MNWTTYELYKLQLQVENEDKVKTAARSVAAVEAEVKKLNATSAQGAKGFGQLAMQAGYFIDDVQYGFKGIANNIPGLLTSLGASGGLAGVLSIVAIAGNMLYENWGKLSRAFGSADTRTQAQAMKELADQTSRTVAESKKLAEYQARQSSEKAQGGPSKAVAGMKSAVDDAVQEFGQESAADTLVKLKRDRYIAADPKLAKLKRGMDTIDQKLQGERELRAEFGTGNMSDEDVAKWEANKVAHNSMLEAGLNSAAKGDLAAAANDPGKRKALQDLVEKNRGAFGANGGELLKNLMDADPAEQKARKAAELDALRQERAAADAKKAQKEADDKTNADDDLAMAREQRERDDQKARKAANISAAKESGVGGLIQEQLKAAFQAGGDKGMAAASDGYREKLVASFGMAGARAILDDAEKGGKKDAIADWIQGDKKHSRTSETIGAADFARQIQAGVGGENIPQKQLERQTRAVAVLEALLAETKKPNKVLHAVAQP